MPPRKLLIATFHFPPCAAVAVHRMVGLARFLPHHDWHTIVIAPPNPPHEPVDPALSRLVSPDNCTLISVPFAEGYWGKLNRKFLPNRLWVHHAKRACAKAIREHKPDAVLTSMPPECIQRLGLWMKKSFGLPWVADFRDPWSSMRRDIPGPPWKWIDAYDERQTMRLADVVVGISPIYSEGLREAYPEWASKIITITNGYDPDNFAESSGPPPRDRWSLLYTGELYFGRDPRPFLDALRELEWSPIPDVPKLGFHFIGRSSPEQCDLAAEVKARGLDQAVTIEGLVPYKKCLQATTAADILVLIHTPGYAHGLPAKIFEYIGARRPVLVLADHPGDIAWVLRESGVLHRIAPLADPPKIKTAIVELVRAMKAGEPIVNAGPNVLPFTRPDMARQFAERLNALVPNAAAAIAR